MSLPLPPLLKRLWTRYWLRRAGSGGRYRELERLYAVSDPWDLSAPREKARYAVTNAVIRAQSPDCRTLLEVGCGEGMQTEALLRLGVAVTGVDVSAAAIDRARRSVPRAEFLCGRAEDLPGLLAGRRFDVATACEVLYYSDNPGGVLAILQAHADCLIVTNYRPRLERLAGCFDGPGWARLESIVAEGVIWEVHAWKRAATG